MTPPKLYLQPSLCLYLQSKRSPEILYIVKVTDVWDGLPRYYDSLFVSLSSGALVPETVTYISHSEAYGTLVDNGILYYAIVYCY